MKRFFVISLLVLSAVIVNAQDAAEMLNQANEALIAKDYAKAFELYDGAMKNIGEVEVDAAINFNIGFSAVQAKKYKAAIPYFDKAIAAGANIAKSHEYKATAYSKLKDYAKSVASYEAAIESETGDKGSMIYNAAITAYKGKLYDKAVELFQKSIDAGYKPDGSYYYKAVVLKKLKKTDEYKQCLIEGAEKFPAYDKITSTLSKEYVSEGNALYKKGAAILNGANEKVNSGTLKTTDAGYATAVANAKVEFKAAVEVLEKATALDAANENAKKLLEACTTNLSM